MKILILGSKEYPMGTNRGDDPSPSGGLEIYVEGLVEALRKYVKIIVITRRFKGTKEYEKKGNVEIYRVPYIKGFLFRNPTFNFNAFLRAKKLNYDVIVSHGEVANFLGLRLAHLRKKPIIMVSHGLASEQPQYNFILREILRFINKYSLTRADAVVTHAPHQVSKIIKKFEVIMPGLDKSRLKKDTSLKAKAKGKVIVFTGRLMKVKGTEYLIEALRYIKDQYTCFIVGDGPERGKLEKLAKELNVNVVFTGFQKNVNRYLSIADVFVLPSLSEALNYSMLEAVCMDVPVVTTNLGVIPENCSITVPFKNPRATAHAIDKVFKDKRLRERITRNANKFAEQFDWNVAAKKYYELVKKVSK